MHGKKIWAEEFEANRPHLRKVAYRMLGTPGDAEDAVQEAWIRLNRTGAEDIANLSGWLTTVVSRVCLDILRSRKTKREESFRPQQAEPPMSGENSMNPDHEMLLADSVGAALLVVLEKLPPSERLAFVLHDMFDVPFDDIAQIVDRSPEAARQLASRARRKVRGTEPSTEASRDRKREIVEAFLNASRHGHFDALLAVLDPDVVFRADATAARLGGSAEVRGADAVATNFLGRAREALPALVDGALAIVVAPQGELRVVLQLQISGGRITAIDAVADPDRLQAFDLEMLKDG